MGLGELLWILFLLRMDFGNCLSSDECWWSVCQPHSRVIRGCFFDVWYPIDSKPCLGGDRYHCCRKPLNDEENSDKYHIHDQSEKGHENIIGEKDNSETGICSYYGENEIPDGHPTASGEPLDRFAMKAAHKTLPFGTRIRVINLSNMKTVDVIINDRGPFIKGRIVDLTFGAFGVVENHRKGLFKCSYTILD